MKRTIFLLCICLFLSFGCSSSSNNNNPSQTTEYVVFAWNDLGMHCLNPTYDTAVILPPYNNLWVQVVQKGNPPIVVTNGITVTYRILNNTYSYGKRNYGQFWDYCQQLFGSSLAVNTGLNLIDPNVHNGLSGDMLAKTGYFVADGIPVTPVNDSGEWNPYQIAEITVKNTSGVTIASTQTTIPTSDELNCSKCHGTDAFANILIKHDDEEETNLNGSKPVLCASCHGSPALGQTGRGSSGKYMSEAIHTLHSETSAVCYDCHPGPTTKCSRSIKHTADDGNCIKCHGNLKQVGNSIASNQRVPWLNEPKCATCHVNVAEVDTGTILYRNSKGHGSLYCEACHSSPHAMIPSNQASDNYQALQYESKAKTIGSCGACHNSSKGVQNISEFASEHGGTNYQRKNACHICHTAVSTDTTKWPHAYQWKDRS
jgi:hypothetical protein